MSKVVISSLERWPPITFYDQGSKIGAYSTEYIYVVEAGEVFLTQTEGAQQL